MLRFWNHEVLGNLEMVVDTIAAHVEPGCSPPEEPDTLDVPLRVDVGTGTDLANITGLTPWLGTGTVVMCPGGGIGKTRGS